MERSLIVCSSTCPYRKHHQVRVRTNSEADATRVWQAEARQAILPLGEDPLQTDLVWVCRAAPVEIGACGREPRPASADQRKSRSRGGRPNVAPEIRRLIREMSLANPLWGAPRIHGELLKLGIDIGQTSVAKYMARRRRPPSQGWKTFLRNHADGIAAMDLFVVPTISFRLLFGLLILQHDRRRVLWTAATARPTAEWIARQLTEACGWEHAPQYLIRDRDRAYGKIVTRRLRTLGIRDRPTSPRSP
jgi:hypothetical protein